MAFRTIRQLLNPSNVTARMMICRTTNIAMQDSHSTNEVPARDRLEYWHSLVSGIFADSGFECEVDQREPFSAAICNQSSGSLDIFEINAVAHSVHRTVEETTNPAIILTLQLQGEGYISQDGRDDVLKPGDFTLLDSSRPFDLRFQGPMKQYVMRIPWQSVNQQLISPKRVAGLSIRGTQGMGHVASTFIQSFINETPRLAHTEASSLFRSLIDIVNASALSVLEQDSRNTTNYSHFQIHRIRLFVEENLRNPDLSPALVAAANGISQRHMNKLFEAEGVSIGRLIWERRLDNCRRDLEDNHLSGKSITEIAHSWGFKSSSHFSRTFKDRFGISPREARAMAN